MTITNNSGLNPDPSPETLVVKSCGVKEKTYFAADDKGNRPLDDVVKRECLKA